MSWTGRESGRKSGEDGRGAGRVRRGSTFSRPENGRGARRCHRDDAAARARHGHRRGCRDRGSRRLDADILLDEQCAVRVVLSLDDVMRSAVLGETGVAV